MSYAWIRSGRISCVAAALLASLACSGVDPEDEIADELVQFTEDGVSGPVALGSTLVTTGNLNFRMGPSTGHKVLRVLRKGTEVRAAAGTPTNGFYQVEHDGTVGWSHGNYLKVIVTPQEEVDSPSCDGFQSNPLLPPSVCDGPGGNTTKEVPKNGLYATSWFGCYRKADGSVYKDPYDNCQFACGPRGYCPSNQSGPECEADLAWFAADADRYGCGALIRVTNCENGKSVVLVTLDRGPNCNSVEKKYGAPVLDMSYPAMTYLFDGRTYGGRDKKRVVVELAPPGTPLGPM